MSAYQGIAGLVQTRSRVSVHAAKADGCSAVAVRCPGDENSWAKLWDAVPGSTKPRAMRNFDPSRLSDEELQEIEARRRRIARAEQAEQLVAYCGSDELFGQEKPARHHALLCDFLQQVERGEIDRLMIFMPPGSAKSTYTSVRFASW